MASCRKVYMAEQAKMYGWEHSCCANNPAENPKTDAEAQLNFCCTRLRPVPLMSEVHMESLSHRGYSSESMVEERLVRSVKPSV